MKRIHLICNAHLDPVWLWRWEEGLTEALSTFRAAENFSDEFNGFAFNHNESLLYEWVKENDKELYQNIKEKVRQGKWNIIGGWYLQPDCNMPCGESFVRNILLGRKFFKEEFDKRPTAAINFDSFGHSKGIVQILNQAGYDSYLVCRPAKDNFDFKSQDYVWKGFNGSEVVVHRSDENYNSIWGQVAGELEKFLSEVKDEEVSLFLWGVGDHGGGPSRKDLRDLEQLFEKLSDEYVFIHSSPEEYFKELREKNIQLKIPVVERGLNPVAQGCYTSQIRVKQKHRELENEIYSAEKMLSAAAISYGTEYPKDKLDEAVRDLIFAEFHDALPGSGSQPVEEDTLRVLNHGLEIISREKLKAAIVLSAGQAPVVDGASSVLIYNPHPYDIDDVFDFEVGLPKQNWENVFYYPEVYLDGQRIPTQSEMETSHFCIDWRKKVSVRANLRASSMHKLDVLFKAIPKRPVFDPIIHLSEYVFDNGEMKVIINTSTGLVDSYIVKGKEYLKPSSFRLKIFDDCYNPWGIDTKTHCNYTMSLLTPHDGSAFSGLGDMVAPSIRIIEDGEVRTVVEALFGWHNSQAYQRYILPKKGDSFDVETGVYWNEKDMYLKLELDTQLADGEYFGQVPFAHDTLAKGSEVVSQKWVACRDEANTIAVINNGTHGSSFNSGVIGLTLLRSPGYSAADGHFEKTLHEVRHTVRMEQGERIFHFRVKAGDSRSIVNSIHSDAQVFNERPYAMAFCPSGKGEKKNPLITIDNQAVIVSCLKLAEDSKGFILRVYESTGEKSSAVIKLGIGVEKKISLNGFEIKTYYFDLNAKTIEECDMLEGF